MTCEISKIDFVEEFYNREMHSVLEKIILILPLPTLINCLKVNKTWEEIVSFYNDSKNSRICQILDDRKKKEWRAKKPRIFAFDLKKFNIFQIDVLHIIGDEREAVIVAHINHSKVQFFNYFIHFLNCFIILWLLLNC